MKQKEQKIFKEPVFSMELDGLEGSHPKILKKTRNVDADNYISAYLNNESIYPISKENNKNQSDINVKMRNPMYADYPYYSARQYSTHIKPTPIQQEPISTEIIQVKRQTPSKSISSASLSVKSGDILDKLQNDQNFKRNEKSFWDIQSEKKQQIYQRHNILGQINETYQPQYAMNIKWNLYDRPQFKDYTLMDMAIPKIINNKNRASYQECATVNKQYGFGTRQFTRIPIYPTSKPQNIDKE